MHMKFVFAIALGAALGVGAVTFGNALSGANAAPDQRFGMAILSAEIPYNGTSGTGSGTTWKRLGTGVFEIFANRKVDGCVYLATPTFLDLFVSTYRQSETSTIVVIRDKNGAYADSPFFALIYCHT